MTDIARAVLEPQDQPLRVATAVIRLAENAHEITLHFEGRELKIVAANAVVIGAMPAPGR